MSAALPMEAPGLRVEPMRFETPALFHAAANAWAMMVYRTASALAARRIRRAMRAGDKQTLARIADAARSRVHRLDRVPVSAMNAIMDGMIERQAGTAGLSRLNWMEGPGGARNDAAILYVPGGSFIIERSPRITALVARIARRAGMPVLVCDYRLAPEHACPAAVEDVTGALRWLMAQGFAPSAIAIAAESAGCNIALAATQQLAAEGVRLGALALLSPWLDLALPHRNIAQLTRISAELYLDGLDPADPRAAPLCGDLSCLPPMAIHACREDPLFADARALAENTARVGGDVTLRVWPGGAHVLERYFNRDTERSIAELAGFLAARLPARSKVA